MSRRLLVALLAVTGYTGVAAQQRTAFAVLPFESQQSFGIEPQALTALSQGLAQLLAGELARSPGGVAVPRSATGEAVAGEHLPANTRIDAATAAKVGKLVGAQYVIVGNFVNFYDKFRINVRIVDATSGEIIRGLSNDDPKLQGKAQMYQSVQLLAQKILKELGLPPAPAGGQGITSEAVIDYSLGLQAEDAGDRRAAAGFYQKAVGASAGLLEAQDGLRRTGGT